MQIGHHHYHHQHDKHPHKGLVMLADSLVYLVSISGVIFTIPQAIQIWSGGNISGVSLTTWVSMLAGSLFWLFYGIIHRDKAIILIDSAVSILNAFIVVGILIYR